MRVITQPKVTLLAKQIFLGHPDYEIPDDGTDAVKIGAFAAKGCYDSFGKNGRANIKNQEAILEHQHGSVLEHVTFTLFIEGITRGLSLESNRHRQLAVSQRSTRYTAEEDCAVVLEPYYASLYDKYKVFIQNPKVDDIGLVPNFSLDELNLIERHLTVMAHAVDAYASDVEMLMQMNPLGLTGFDLRKWARGKARNILPHALETRITYTGNVRAWRWVIESRSDKHAEPEIRRLAVEIHRILNEECPTYFSDFAVSEIYDGIPVLTPKHRKV
jgi:thymidylate synthase (FAD)